ncbi:hypothetical protein [Leyella lascolaii]|uniref:hypothetical protein n=1 Tax=Leyella lascolaii TaxID=1776379 RepID=UPI0025ADBAAD|nr:hypothetical protein [Leyella lascolaii]
MNTVLLLYSIAISVFARTVAVTLYPSGNTALVPGINIHDHTNNAAIRRNDS